MLNVVKTTVDVRGGLMVDTTEPHPHLNGQMELYL